MSARRDTASLRVRLLGAMEVRRVEADGESEPIELPQSKKTRALLAYLLLVGRAQRRSRLGELLWEDAADPRASLRWSLSKLRPILDAERQRLVARGDEVSLDTSDVEVDVLELRRMLEGDPRALDRAVLERAAGAFGGLFLEDLDLADTPGFHAWCVANRDELRSLHVRSLEALVEKLAAHPEAALAHARRLAELDPGDERALGRLLTVLGAAGRRKAAEELFEAHRARLDARGLAPGAPLLAAWHSVRAQPASAPEAHAPPAAGGAPEPSPARQQIRFCRGHGGVQIAYATSGSGPPLVKTAHWLTHLEYDWESPVWRPLLGELSGYRTLVRHDQRGSGLSDRGVDDLSLDAFVRDLEAVLDALSLDRYPLLGVSQGAAVAVAHAVRYPERVTHLVILNGFGCGWRARGSARLVEATEALITLAGHGWGQSHPAFRQVFTSLMMPDAPHLYQTAFNELQRRTASAEEAVRLIRAFGELDVREILGQVRVPTLVLHARHDGMIPFSEGRALASGIPGARLVPLETRSHVLLPYDPAWGRFVSELREFIST